MLVTAGILVAIGAQFATGALNHKQSSKHMKKMQALQQEYEEALQQDGFKRAWDKHTQLNELQKELEKELHQRRIDNIEQSFNRYLDMTAYSQALKNWPLRVLPFVMKDESLFSNGSVDTNNKIALHCLLTRGNDENFNKTVFRELEVRLSQHFNLFWGANSSHPILFYSGAWKELYDASAVVDNLYNQLEKLPTIVISPWIDENNEFYFKVSVWGIPNVEMRNSIYKPEGVTFSFKQGQAEYTKEETQQILNEIDPILTAFVGYIADQYYWRYNNTTPLLPKLIDAGMVALPAATSIDFKQQYIDLLENYITDPDSMILHPELSIGLCKSLDNEITKKEYLQKVFIVYCQRYNNEISSMEDAVQLDCFTKIDLSFLKTFISAYEFDDFRKEIEAIIEFLLPLDFDYSILEMTDIDKLKTLVDAGNTVAMFRLGEIYEYSIGTKWNQQLSIKFYDYASKKDFILNNDISQLTVLKRLANLCELGIMQAKLVIAKKYNQQGLYDKAIQLIPPETTHPGLIYLRAELIQIINSDSVEVEKLLSTAADAGYIEAQLKLAAMFKKGDFLPENPQQHFLYIEKAMLQNHPAATYEMAMCLINGYGTQSSTRAAMILIDRAVELGFEEAKRIRVLLNSI